MAIMEDVVVVVVVNVNVLLLFCYCYCRYVVGLLTIVVAHVFPLHIIHVSFLENVKSSLTNLANENKRNFIRELLWKTI